MELHIKPKMTIMILLGVLLTTSGAFAQLKLESVYPALGVMDQGMEGAYSLPKQTILTQGQVRICLRMMIPISVRP